MSAKWRAIQHRHRYTYSAVIFPQYFTEALDLASVDGPCSNYYNELKELVSLNSIYSQVNHAKRVASAFDSLLKNGDENSVSAAAKFYLETLFLENSLQLHRTLVSPLVKNKTHQSLICDCFQRLCEEYGGVNGKGKRFCVSRVALSMMSSPKLGYLVEIVEECAVLVGFDVVFGLNSVVSETDDWSRPSPIVMEQCQEALSCMYYLLQRFPLKFIDLNGTQMGLVPAHSNVMEMILEAIFSILKSVAFSRDCFVAAGVSFWSAVQVILSSKELGFAITEGIFCQKIVDTSDSKFENAVSKFPYLRNLFSEIHNFLVLSRLCLIRGILTAVSRTILNTQFHVSRDAFDDHGNDGGSVWTILYDGILPELCNYCENPVDSHFNFHSLTVMQICLQQIKTLVQGNHCIAAENYDPISENLGTRVLRIIWNNLEDPLNQTVKQVHLIFDLFLDIQSTLCWAEGSDTINSYLRKIASDLLRLGARCKGRYVPLASLTRRLGAKAILSMSPNLLGETCHAYNDDDVCCAATTFLKCFLENLRDECWSSDGIDSGYTKYRVHCLPPFLLGLASGVSKLRSNLNTYALPVLLEVDIDSIFPMLAFISVGQSGDSTAVLYPELDCMDITLRDEQKVAVLVSLLKVSRSLALTEGDIDCCEISSLSKKEKRLKTDYNDCHAVVCIKGIKVNVPVGWLALALTHMDESIRIDAAECLFLNPKTSSLPSSLELNLMKEAVPLNMRCCSTAFQMKWNSLFRKFFSRVRTALDRQIKQGSWRPLMSVGNSNMSLFKGTEDTVVDRADDLFHFMKWLSCLLFFSCYPSAPYERKIMAMEMILTMISVWSIVGGDSDTITLNPYSKGFTSPDSTLLLVGSIIDSWDRLRGSSFRILLHFPTPLPGISCPDMVQQVIISAKKLVCSARVRESDAGALTLRIMFRKYVLELGWIVRVSCNVVSFYPEPQLQNGDLKDNTSFPPTIEYLRSLVDWLRMAVEEGEKDLSEACTNSFVHGVLLTLRYTFEELDWNSDVVLGSTSAVKNVLEKLLELVMRITSLALWVVSADAWYLPDDMDGMVDDDAFLLEASVDRDDASVPASEDEVRNAKHAQDAGSSEQIVMVGCWLAMKEVSLLLGTIIRKIPLPTSDLSVTRVKISDNGLVVPSDVMLDLKQLETIGNHFVEVLLKMKHNGAIDKTRAGFTALCNRLLCSNDPRLCKLTDSWMEQLMERTVAKGQTVDDLLRRSAGIPAAFIALFLSEPEGTPKRLLPKALRWLIDVASKSLVDQHKVDGSDKDGNNSFSTETLSILQPNMDVNRSTLKTRDEGVVPTVHAFNALRAAFNDTNLATDTSGFSAEALIISIRSFSSPYWEVRNSACLAYTALVRRMIGFLNVQKRESVRRAVTGLEFFHRYPSLHSFLLNELKVATEFLTDGSSKSLQSNLVKVVHPSLCPMLILLSRLKPSTVTSETGDELDPFLFMPFIRRCSTQSNLRVRVLASRALTGLVSNEKLPAVILNIASELPASAKQLALNSIHGMLLHLSSLLNNNCRNLADYCKKDVILNDLIQVLEMRSWIGRPRLCPCPILNGCFLKVLDHMLSIVRSCQVSKSFGSIRNLLWELSPECLDLDPFHGRLYFDPTIAELREQAVISYLNCVFHTSKELLVEDVLKPCPSNISNTFGSNNDFGKFHERLMLSMSDASYEVRIATLKWLLRFLKAAESGTTSGDQSYYVTRIISWSEIELQEKLLKLLSEEKNHKCVYYILKILFTWNLLQFQKQGSLNSEMIFIGNMNCDSVFQFWGKLVFLYGLTRHAKTREILICCMGLCINRFTDSLIEFSQLHLFDCISFYVNLIKQQTDSAQPVTMRKAASESIVASGLLEQAQLLGSSLKNDPIPSGNPLQEVSRVYAHNILDTWFTCIKLLEDEDIEIRSKLAVDVQKCFSSGNNNRAGVVPGQVEKVIELSFDHLSSIFGHWIEYFDYLSRWVFTVANYVVVRGGDLVRRVFDKEIDNHHEEKLLVCQICCSHLEKLPISRTWVLDFSDKDEPRKFLHEWRTRFCQKLISFANDHVGKQVEWIGGVGNHKDAFLPLYTNLLGFFAVSNCIFNVESEIGYGKSLLSDVKELGKAIYPFLRNPLISNLFLLVVSLHEKVVGETVDHLIYRSEGDESLWEGFDPYFLLG